MSMFKMKPLAVAALAIYAIPSLAQEGEVPAAAAPQSSEAVSMPEVRVEDSVEPAYKADVVSSPKFTQPLLDTPQTIQVITSELFTQQGATTLTEALRNSAAVGTFYAGENGNTTTGDAIYMRGFDTSSSIFVDGVRDLGSISRDIFNIDQVEVEKGPAGTDNGRTAPTGAINMASKQALLENAVSGTISTGTDGQNRVTADLNQTLNGLAGSALRLNALWQDSDVPGRDQVNNSRIGLAPSLGFNLEGETRAYANLLYVEQNNIPDGHVPTIGLPGWTPQPGLEQLAGHPVDSENFYGTQYDHDDVTAKMATLIVEHDVAKNVRLRNIARWGETTQDYLLTAFMSTGGSAEDPQAGNIKWTDADDLSTYTINRSNLTFKDQQNKILTDQLNLIVDFATGSVQHTLSAGLEFAREELFTHSITSSGTVPAANLYDPDWHDAGTLSWARNGAGAHGKTDTTSIYAFDTLKFSERWLVTGGLRADRYQTDYRSTAVCNNGTGRGAVPCGDAPVGTIVETVDADSKDTLLNWKLGAVYKPVEAGSVYANYAISQQPPGGDSFQLSTSASSLNNPDMDPQKAKTYELGTKWNLLRDALTLNFALFRTEVTNEINTQVTDEAGNPTQTGEKRVEGVELSAVGSITANWSVSAGYTHMKTRVEEGAPVSVDGSSNLTYTPEEAFTSWTTYRFPFGFTVGGGVRYSDGLHRGTDGAVGTPKSTQSYTVCDAVASYAFNPSVTLRVNAYNILDEDYVAAINKSGYRYTPGAPRTFLISGDFRF
jgi:catecholate siderophore receptor